MEIQFHFNPANSLRSIWSEFIVKITHPSLHVAALKWRTNGWDANSSLLNLTPHFNHRTNYPLILDTVKFLVTTSFTIDWSTLLLFNNTSINSSRNINEDEYTRFLFVSKRFSRYCHVSLYTFIKLKEYFFAV